MSWWNSSSEDVADIDLEEQAVLAAANAAQSVGVDPIAAAKAMIEEINKNNREGASSSGSRAPKKK